MGSKLTNGVLASLAGGVVFGLLMQMMGMIGMIGMMVGSESIGVSWLVHLGISALFGLFFGLALGNFRPQWAGGLIYGAIWYVLGPLTLMPLFMGMGLMWSLAGITGSMGSLMGHLLYGLVLGLAYGWLEARAAAAGKSAAA